MKRQITELMFTINENNDRFFNTGYKAFFIKNENRIIGYILCDVNKDPIYLRQFLYYGREAFLN
jgi:hypothetical protein